MPYHVWAAGSAPNGETMWLGCCSWAYGHWGETFFSVKLARVGPVLLVLSSRGGKETSVRGAGRSCPREKLLEALLLLIPAGWELTSVPGLCGTGAGQEVHGDQGEETQSGLGAPGQDKVALNSPTDFSLGLAPTPHFIPPQAPCPPSLPYTLLGNEVIWKNNQKIERKKKAKKMGFFFSPFKHLVRHLPHG